MDDQDQTVPIQVPTSVAEEAQRIMRIQKDIMDAVRPAAKAVQRLEQEAQKWERVVGGPLRRMEHLLNQQLPLHDALENLRRAITLPALETLRSVQVSSGVLEAQRAAESISRLVAEAAEPLAQVHGTIRPFVGTFEANLARGLRNLDWADATAGDVTDLCIDAAEESARSLPERIPVERIVYAILLPVLLYVVFTWPMRKSEQISNRIHGQETLDELRYQAAQEYRRETECQSLAGAPLPLGTHELARRLLLHRRPSAESESVQPLDKGETVTVYATHESWACVILVAGEDGMPKTGWLYAPYLHPVSPN